MIDEVTIGPQPGPQTAFMACPADVALYGGGAGSGKSFALLMDPLRAINVKGFSGVIFRRSFPEIKQGGGLWDTSMDLYPSAGGKPNLSGCHWTFETEDGGRSRLSFSHLQHESTVFNHQGGQYAFIGFDELTHFSLRQFTYLIGRNRSTCGVRPWIRATCNPDPDSWVYSELVKWYLTDDGYPDPEKASRVRYFGRKDGRIVWADTAAELSGQGLDPLSFAFIPALIGDNPALLAKDPGYKAKLNALLPHEKARLLNGNWLARESAGCYFPEKSWRFVLVPPGPDSCRIFARGWDRAATEPSPSSPDPDWTVGVKMCYDTSTGRFTTVDVERFRLGPGETRQRIKATAMADGPDCIQVIPQDPGSAGKTEAADLVRALAGSVCEIVNETGDKLTRARPFAVQVQAGNVEIVQGASWVPEYMRELAQAGGPMGHDDQMDASSTAFNYITGGSAANAPGVH